jgi:hypothetical protein
MAVRVSSVLELSSVSVADVPVQVRTLYLQNRSQEQYSFLISWGEMISMG